MIPHQSVRDMAEVARKLGDLVHEVVFLGGAAVPLLVPAAVVPTVRSTDDVDCVVRAETYSEYSHFGERFRKLEECRDEGAPICRWTVTWSIPRPWREVPTKLPALREHIARPASTGGAEGGFGRSAELWPSN